MQTVKSYEINIASVPEGYKIASIQAVYISANLKSYEINVASVPEGYKIKVAKRLIINIDLVSEVSFLYVLSDIIFYLQVPKYEDGNFVGPTILADVSSDMECYNVICHLSSPLCILIIFV